MLFNSYIFILLFLPIAIVGYFMLNRFGLFQLGKTFLLGMSLWFYGYFNINYLPIIVISILFNYGINVFLHRSFGGRKLILLIGVAANLGVLFYFKYYDFFIANINGVFGTDFTLLRLILPLGISFFTFQQLSYVIDSYKGTVPNYNLLDYSLFVTFFPQLIAGPIVLHSEMVPQFEDANKKLFNYDNFAKGIMAFAFGLAKKVLIADIFGKVVNYGYGNISGLSAIDASIVIFAFTIQIYFDFSGYCDMTTGIGLMFNIEIPQNFNSPYKARTIEDFWKRWHMTLTRFFTRYVYIPLGGNRKGPARTYINMLIVFLVSGLWHGANWTFLFWGMLHGVAIVLTKLLKPMIAKVPKIICWIVTFGFVNLTWVYFRADSIAQGNSLLRRLLSMDFDIDKDGIVSKFATAPFQFLNAITQDKMPGYFGLVMLAWMVFALVAVIFMKNTNERIMCFHPSMRLMCVVTFLLFWSVISLSGVSTFLYFNF